MNLENLQFLFKPKYWILTYFYNEEVDKIINELLDNNKLVPSIDSQYIYKLGKANLLIVQYGIQISVSLYGTSIDRYRPSRLTIKRTLDKVAVLKDRQYKQKFIETKIELLGHN